MKDGRSNVNIGVTGAKLDPASPVLETITSPSTTTASGGLLWVLGPDLEMEIFLLRVWMQWMGLSEAHIFVMLFHPDIYLQD